MAEGFCKRVYSDGTPGFFIGELAGEMAWLETKPLQLYPHPAHQADVTPINLALERLDVEARRRLL